MNTPHANDATAIWNRDRTTAAVSYPLAKDADGYWTLLSWSEVNEMAVNHQIGQRFYVVYPPWINAPNAGYSTYHWRLSEFEVAWSRKGTGRTNAIVFREASCERMSSQRVADFKSFAGLA